MLYELIYTSVANQPLAEEELVTLLEQARARNDKQGITGFLIYHNREFVQLLEGNKEDVFDIYASICDDGRHTSVNTFFNRDVAERSFKNWEMGFLNINSIDTKKIKSYSEYFKHGASCLQTTNTESDAKSLLLYLCQEFLERK